MGKIGLKRSATTHLHLERHRSITIVLRGGEQGQAASLAASHQEARGHYESTDEEKAPKGPTVKQLASIVIDLRIENMRLSNLVA